MVTIHENKPHITFVIHDIEGGIASMNHQIIENANFREYFQVHILMWRSDNDRGKPFRDKFSSVDTVTNFYFSNFDNYYFTLKRFSETLNIRTGLLVSNDGFELEAIRSNGTNSVLYSIVHDFYNLKLAVENSDIIDYFICHTEVFYKALMSNYRLQDRVAFMLHGVKLPDSDAVRKINYINNLKIVSISRLTESKGVLLLWEVNKMLLESGISVFWVIIGSGELKETIIDQWNGHNNIEFFAPDSREEVYNVLSDCDVFISPSIFEGYGIALLESMANSIVPVIYRLPVGVYSDLPADTGFSVNLGDVSGLADAIKTLHLHRESLNSMGAKAVNMIKEKFDIEKTAFHYLNYFKKHNLKRNNKNGDKRRNVKSILDSRFMPNMVTRFLKKLKQEK